MIESDEKLMVILYRIYQVKEKNEQSPEYNNG